MRRTVAEGSSCCNAGRFSSSADACIGAAAQRPLYQVHGAFGGRQVAPFVPVCPERDVERVRRGVLGKFDPDGPVSLAGSLKTLP
jgi:hypothetical protein